MDEKEYRICNICRIVGNVALLVGIILIVAGSNPDLLAISLLFLCIASIAYAIKLYIEILSGEETWIISVLVLALLLFDIASAAMQLG